MLHTLLNKKSFLWLLFIGNLLGTIYGYIWYIPQLQITAPKYWMFVPDSPTALLFFLFALGSILLHRHWPLMEALALVTLIKYGTWAVGMNVFLMFHDGNFYWTSLMLAGTHAFMAVEAVIFIPYFRFRFWHFAVAAIWVLHNDVIDYVFGQMPIYMGLEHYLPIIGYFTFWLTIAVLALVYIRGLRKNRFILDFSHLQK